jgi:hypothetical protein
MTYRVAATTSAGAKKTTCRVAATFPAAALTTKGKAEGSSRSLAMVSLMAKRELPAAAVAMAKASTARC